jgi:hypothetical protein
MFSCFAPIRHHAPGGISRSLVLSHLFAAAASAVVSSAMVSEMRFRRRYRGLGLDGLHSHPHFIVLFVPSALLWWTRMVSARGSHTGAKAPQCADPWIIAVPRIGHSDLAHNIFDTILLVVGQTAKSGRRVPVFFFAVDYTSSHTSDRWTVSILSVATFEQAFPSL